MSLKYTTLLICLFLSKVPVNNRKLRVSLTPIPPSLFQHSASCWDFIQNSSLKEMQTSLCLADLRDMLPPPYKVKRATRSSLSVPSHALEEPTSRTHSTGRSFLHTAVSIWNSLPEDIVGLIGDRLTGEPNPSRCVCTSTYCTQTCPDKGSTNYYLSYCQPLIGP